MSNSASNNSATMKAANAFANGAAQIAAANGANAQQANAVAQSVGNAVVSGNHKNAANAAAMAAKANGMTPAAANAVGNGVNAMIVANSGSGSAPAQFPAAGPLSPAPSNVNFRMAPPNNAGSPLLPGMNSNAVAAAPPIADASPADPQTRPADGRLGAYVPSDTYLHGATLESGSLAQNLMARPKLGAACADSDRGCTLFRGPADAAPAQPVASLFPLALESGNGFDEVLVDAPLDLLYADQLMGDDVNVLTTTKNQSWDLRGEPAIDAIYVVDNYGVAEPGSAGGAYVPSLGPYQLRKAVRQFIA